MAVKLDRRFRIAALYACVLFMCGQAGSGVVLAQEGSIADAANASHGPIRLLALDIELEGDRGGPELAEEHAARIRTVSARVREELESSGLYDVVDDPAARALIDKAGSEQNLHRCNGCELDLAGKLGARQVLVPWVYRVSNLILTLKYEIRDVSTGKTVASGALDFRGDNDASWTRAVKYMVRGLKEKAEAAPAAFGPRPRHGPLTASVALSRISALDAPICTSYRPGSTAKAFRSSS